MTILIFGSILDSISIVFVLAATIILVSQLKSKTIFALLGFLGLLIYHICHIVQYQIDLNFVAGKEANHGWQQSLFPISITEQVSFDFAVYCLQIFAAIVIHNVSTVLPVEESVQSNESQTSNTNRGGIISIRNLRITSYILLSSTITAYLSCVLVYRNDIGSSYISMEVISIISRILYFIASIPMFVIFIKCLKEVRTLGESIQSFSKGSCCKCLDLESRVKLFVATFAVLNVMTVIFAAGNLVKLILNEEDNDFREMRTDWWYVILGGTVGVVGSIYTII